MSAPRGTRKRSRSRAVAILFLPTLPQRLTLLGVLVFVAVTILAPSYAGYATIPFVALPSVAGFIAVRGSIRKMGYRMGLLRALEATVNVVIIGFAVILATRFVATGGTIGTTSRDSRLQFVELDIVIVTLVLLLWVPQLFFHIQLDRDGTGNVQRVLLGLIAVTASILTGVYILGLHFAGGPLRNISMAPLFAGVVGLVVIMTPAYRSLARACWRRGISDIFQLRKQRQDWSKALAELGTAVDRARHGWAETDQRRVQPPPPVPAAATRTDAPSRSRPSGRRR
jgi:hypothetical protein